MKVVPYLNFAGQAEDALKFYEHALHGKISSIMRYGENPFPGMDPEKHQWIMHGELEFGDNKIYVSDFLESDKMVLGNAYGVHLDCDSEDEIRHLFDHFSEGAIVDMPLEDAFWGAIFGSLTDKFGIQWSFNFQKS